MSDENQIDQEQGNQPAAENFESNTEETNVAAQMAAADAAEGEGENPTALDADGNPVALEPAIESETATPAEESIEKDDDVVSVTRAKYEISEEVADALVIEFASSTLDNIGTWTTELLFAVLKGQIRFPETDLKHAIIVYRQRVEIPSAWNDQQVVAFIRSGEEPKKTSNGVWVIDVTRASRAPADWSTAELEAWALGEIQAGGKSTDNGVAIELKARLKLGGEQSPKAVRKAYRALKSASVAVGGASASQPVVVPYAEDESEQLQQAKAVVAQIEKVEGLTSMNVAFIDDGLAKYIEAVQPNKQISEEAALRAQNALDVTFQYIIGLEDPKAMVTALERLKVGFKKQMERGGVFDANNVFRFTHLMRSDNKRQQRHKDLLELFRIYFSDAKEARKQVDLRILLQYQPADKAELLVEYFTKIA